MSATPTLDELIQRLRSQHPHKDSFREHFRRVASGEAPASLRGNNARFAAQVMVILIDHANKEEAKHDQA